MGKWLPTRHASRGGRFQLVAHKLTPGGARTDITYVRSAATQLTSYSNADPFGDSTAVFAFPAVTAFDDFDAPDLAGWLGNYSNIDLYWVPAVVDDGRYTGREAPVFNPLTQALDVVTPALLRDPAGKRTATHNRIKVWEGFIASMEFSTGSDRSELQVQCQGALFELDHYLAKPFYPARPWPLEKLIADVFSHTRRPHLRTRPLRISWPDGWTKTVPGHGKGEANLYTPVAKPGSKWSGLASRNTGSWEHALTGFVQDQLAVMITDNDCGVTPGNQFTVLHHRETSTTPGRQPVLTVRDRFRPADFAVWLGTPGIEVSLSSDATQSENLVYGSGTDLNGETWRNAVVSDEGTRTDYLPLAYDRNVYPARDNPAYHRGVFASEAYVTFGSGFSQPDATTVAEQQLARDRQPGWSGSITLSVDPSPGLSRWVIRAGMTVQLQGFAGTGQAGLPLHVASVEAAPMSGTVTLTVDTRYRDLLTVAEAQARTRDPLNPVRMLQVNKTSVLVEDIQAPWDYQAGSGFIPKAAKSFYEYKPKAQTYPYTDWSQQHPPLHYGQWYVKCNAAAGYQGNGVWTQTPPFRKRRWSKPVPILTSEKGTISRTEIYVVDVYGRPVKAPFHVSFYYVNVTVAAMPRDGNGPSPYIDGAFESINPATGQMWPEGNFFSPNQGFIIGWGNRAAGIYNRAGFSPGSEAAGNQPTGHLFDDSTWTFDNTNHPDYDPQAKPGQRQAATAITIHAMFYCEYPEPVYFQGRLFRQNPGTA